jgi:ATP-dependent DNA helicase RecG
MTEKELRNLLARSEGKTIEYKQTLPSRRDIIEYAVGIGNAGGGFLIIGVSNAPPRQIVSVQIPPEDELAKIRASVADAAQIHINVEPVPTSEGNVLVIRIPPRPAGVPFHTRDGKYLIRVEDELRGMTIPEIDAARREAGMELTAFPIQAEPSALISASGMEELRRLMSEAGAAADLIKLPDADLLRSLGVLAGDGRLLMAGLLLVGTPEALRAHAPGAEWRFFRMTSDTQYDQTESGSLCLPQALKRLRELVAANNPIVTIPGWLVHPEFPRYPALALRELIVNALVHRDYSAPGAVTLKLYPDRLELSNPGGFVVGVTAENILHHPSVTRYRTLFEALTRMRLANAANLGVPRVYRDLLSEGKEPPIYWSSGGAVRVAVKGQEARREFLDLVHRYPDLDVDHLLVIHYLTRHREVNARTAAEICQRPLQAGREILGQLVTQWALLEAAGGGKGRYYRLSRTAYEILRQALAYHVDRRLSLENAKARVLGALSFGPLTNADIREITQMDRRQVITLMKSLESEGLVEVEKRGRGSRWRSRKGSGPDTR